MAIEGWIYNDVNGAEKPVNLNNIVTYTKSGDLKILFIDSGGNRTAWSFPNLAARNAVFSSLNTTVGPTLVDSG